MRTNSRMARLMLALLVLCLGARVSAQEINGTISGTVKDINGASVQGASVTLTDTAKNVVLRTTTTDESGAFTLPDIPSALYDIAVEAQSFKKHVESGFKLDVGQRRNLDVVLEVGSISETVTVQAAEVSIQLTTPAASTVINGDQIRQLSINNRNFVSLVTLAPGVTNDLDDLVFTGTNNPETQVINRASISVNGARTTQNTFTVDGADVTDRGSNLTIQAYPSVDSIGEFQVLRSLYPAESGRSGGGQINVITRSGGNEFHGNVFEFIRNEAFNANDFQTNRTPGLIPLLGLDSNGKIKRRPFRYNNYGFTIGGPVYFFNFGEGSGPLVRKMEKTFFFFSEEQRRDTRYPTLSSVVPTAQMKQGVFPVNICLSATNSTTCTSTLNAGTPLSSVATISPVAQQYLTLLWNNIPGPTNPATLALDFPTLNQAKFRQEIIKIDHSFSNNWNMFYRFENDKIPTIDADGSLGTIANGGRSGLPFINRMESNSPGRTHTFQTTYTFNPNLLFEGRVTYGFGAILTKTIGLLAKDVSPISVNLPYQSVRDVVPIVNITGFNPLQGFSNYDNYSSKTNFSGAVTWIRGAHTMKFGAMYTTATKHENALSGQNQGNFNTFSNTIPSLTSPACVRATGVPSNALNNLYQNWACFLLGNNVTFTQSKLDLTIDFRQKSVEWFAQDEWRARPGLTLYYGVRHSYFGPPYDRNGQLSNFDPLLWNRANAPIVNGLGDRRPGTGNFCNGLIVNAQNYSTGPAVFNCTPASSPYGKYVYSASKTDFGPRVGLAWDPFGKGTTSIRTGYGIYHEQIPLGSIELQALNPPYQETATINRTTMAQPLPPGQPIPVVAAAAAASVRGIQTDFKTPYMQHWSLDLQHQFGRNTIVTAGYFGSKGTHLIGFTEYNDLALNRALTTQCASGTNALQDPGVVTVPCMVAGTAFTSSAGSAILDQIRPFRGYRSINILESRYNSNYHSLQVFAQHRLSGASQLNLSYTWSKNLTDNQTSTVNAAPQDANNIRAEYSRALLDRRQVLSINYIYELPFFREQHNLKGKVLGGWQISGIVSHFTGVPFTVSYSSYDPAGIGYIPAITAGGRPLLLCDPNSGAPGTVDQWFNTACFSAQTPAGATGVLNLAGNAPRGAVDGPPTTKFDLTLAKTIRFSESVGLQLRAEAFNVLNHTNFRTLSTSRAITNTTFGAVASFRDPRIMQFGVKLSF